MARYLARRIRDRMKLLGRISGLRTIMLRDAKLCVSDYASVITHTYPEKF